MPITVRQKDRFPEQLGGTIIGCFNWEVRFEFLTQEDAIGRGALWPNGEALTRLFTYRRQFSNGHLGTSTHDEPPYSPRSGFNSLRALGHETIFSRQRVGDGRTF